MKKELMRFGLSAATFMAVVAAAGTLTVQDAAAASPGGVKRVLSTCPNPGPWWCDVGGENDRCADGSMDWRGCYDWTIFI